MHLKRLLREISFATQADRQSVSQSIQRPIQRYRRVITNFGNLEDKDKVHPGSSAALVSRRNPKFLPRPI